MPRPPELDLPNSCGTTAYTWDARNRLTDINGFNTDCSALSADFKYDALGRRIEKTVNGRTIQYLYDGQDIVQEIEDGVVSANYIRTLNIDEPLARIEEDGIVRYYHADALRSIVALTGDNGNVVTQYGYSPFRKVTISGETSDNPFQYNGRENDETGLYYYRARYYNPAMKRFISEDPIGLGGGINFYVYVGNSPVNWIDPWGLIGIGAIVKGGKNGVAAVGMGRMTGAIVGGGFGALGGSFLFPGGSVVGGMAGAWLGGNIGGLFDHPCDGQLNCEEPIPIPPESPGPVCP